jgi:hypothetical protein
MKMQRDVKKGLVTLTLILWCSLAFGVAAQAFSGTPTLSINIPTVKLTDIPVTEATGSNTVDIPWIAQYIAGLYRYSVGFAAMIGTVMIVIGGFQYLTGGGDASRVMAGKQRIADAVIGMLLVSGSYVILSTVNPDLVSLNSLQILLTKRRVMAQDQNTLNKTTLQTADAPVGTAPGTGGPSGSPGVMKENFASCPFPLTEEGSYSRQGPGYNDWKVTPGKDPRLTKDARRNAFIEKVKPFATGTTQEKLLKIAEAAMKCGVHFGSCGGTAGAIYALAGVGDPKCLNSDGECRNHEKAKIVVGIPSGAPLRKVLCSHKERCCKQYKACNIDNTGCVEDKSAAIQKVSADLANKHPGYPDSWANQLQPGDIIWVYNANADCGGQHSAMFMGWQGNYAQVIQGAWAHNAYGGRICVKKGCGASQQAITQIFRAP